MWFTRTDDSFRAWFQVITGTGVLRRNILSSSFIATVINPNDTLHVSASVTQSLQKEGVYYFTIPSSFLTASGPGEYGVSVEIDVTTAPKVTTAFSDVLRVSYQDFDTIVSSTLSASSGVPVTISTSSIESFVSGVWSAPTSSYNTPGTMGYFQVFPIVSVSASISASVDVPSIVSGVWNAATAAFSTAGTMGGALGGISSSFAFTQQQLFEISSSVATTNTQLGNLQTDVSYISSSIGVTNTTLTQISGTVNLTYDTLVVVSSSVSEISSSMLQLTNTFNSFTSSLGSSGSIAAAVWDEMLSAHSVSGSTGLALTEVAGRLHEIYQILGLELGSPMTVTQTLRTVAAISQSLAGDPTLGVTVTRL
jgi:hypothetical protein